MALKKDAIYSMRGKYKLVAPSYRMIEADSDNEQDPTYVPPPGLSIPTTKARVIRGTPRKVTSSVVTTQSLIRSAYWLVHRPMLPIVFNGAQHLGSSLILLQGQPNLLGQKQTPLPIPPLREPLERRGKSTKRYDEATNTESTPTP